MLKHLLFSAFLTVFCTAGLAQDTTIVKESEFFLNLDWTRFRGNDSLTYFEFSGAVSRNLPTYQQENDRYSGEFIVDAAVFQHDSLIERKIWRNVDHVDSLSQVQSDKMLSFINHFFLSPGNYQLSLSVFDAVDSINTVSRSLSVPIIGFSDSLAMSDVQMASHIEQSRDKGPFVKNGFRVLPNTSRIYGLSLPILYTYAEIYNLSSPKEAKYNTYSVEYNIYDTDANRAKPPVRRVFQKPGHSAVAVNQITVTNLFSGTYLLNVKVVDHDLNDSLSVNRKFYVYRRDDFAKNSQPRQTSQKGSSFKASYYDQLNEKELDQEFQYLRYINTRKDRKVWKGLSLSEKREFLPSLWMEYDKSPETPINEFKRQYLQRIQQANALFGNNNKAGWKTDRGRILVIYGRPDDVERNSIVGIEREYHVWHYYDILGGAIFVFVDKRDLGNLELVHSTAPRELHDPDWQRWITR
ncbi:MAG: GWxTD domain-containing protein [candidate division KSB1 bacterium]|nr:GWxTD domain-containing protein [candidate division KSB1 bacterium]